MASNAPQIISTVSPLESRVPSSSPIITASEARKQMRILLIEPESPPTFWSYHHLMPWVGKRAALAPLGLTTLAGMLPKEWDLDLADANIGPLEQGRLERADAVFIGGMHVQAQSFHEHAKRARAAGKIVVGGGPYVTTSPEECMELDHLVLGEVEEGIDAWTRAFEQGNAPEIAQMPLTPDLGRMPIPRHDLINPEDYFSMGIQLGRGCPHGCEFCSVTQLNGREPRLKTADQFLAEAENIRQSGFRGSTFVVDDNFIGNHRAVEAMMPKIAAWQKKHGYPLDLFTQADLRLAKYDSLMGKMVDAGFAGVFLGIETPSKEALKETGKHQNANVDLDKAVRKIAAAGLEPMGGFIMGFDSDKPEDLDELGAFINRNPIPKAMVGVLQAAPKTKLHKRMASEGRLLPTFDGDQFGKANFETVMDADTLRRKYGEVLGSIYAPDKYFARCLQLLQLRTNSNHSTLRARPQMALRAIKNSIIKQGILSDYRLTYWKFLAKVATTMPKKLATGLTHAIKFHHLDTYTRQDVLPRLG